MASMQDSGNVCVSIITINYNNRLGLEKTIVSVIHQDFSPFEFIVIDGNSEDGSKDILAKYSKSITYVESEADRGIYHAMNKGIRRASGRYLLFLNSGDYFHSSSSLSILCGSANNCDIVYGNILVDQAGKQWIKRYPSFLEFRHFYFDSLPHPASLIKRTLMDRLGGYNEELKIVADWEGFLIAVMKLGCTYKYVDVIVSVFSYDGISSRQIYQNTIQKEKEQVFKNQFPHLYSEYQVAKELSKFSNKLVLRLFQFFGLFQFN